MLPLYFDEDSMRRTLIGALRTQGVDVLTAMEAGMIERDDEEHLDFATTRGRVLYSFNVGDYTRLHGIYLRTSKPHAGIIVAPQRRYSVGEQMRRLLKLIAARSPAEMANHLEYLSSWA